MLPQGIFSIAHMKTSERPRCGICGCKMHYPYGSHYVDGTTTYTCSRTCDESYGYTKQKRGLGPPKNGNLMD